jgi:hypothetical protein
LISDIKGGTCTEGVSEQGAEENIWTEEGLSDRLELQNLYSSPSIIRMGRACSTHGDKWNAYRILVGKLEGNRPLGRHRHMWGDNIVARRPVAK